MAAKGRRHVQAFLHRYDHDAAIMPFVSDLLGREERHLPSSQDTPPVSDIALFGIEDAEWVDAVKAARLQFKLEQLSGNFPMISVTDEVVEADGVRFQVWCGQSLRPNVLEDWLGLSISSRDMQVFHDALQMLPKDWSLVVEIARGTR